MEKIPVYELRINPEKQSLVDVISIVDEPAILQDFIAFNKQEEIKFSVDEERMELFGPVMIPNMKIIRMDKLGNPYYVFFSGKTIRQIAQTYFENGFQNNMNIQHSDKNAESFVFQSYIVDRKFGMNPPKKWEHVPDETWFAGVKVKSKEHFQDFKSGKQKGFSIEGVFELFEEEFAAQQQTTEQKLLEVINKINQSIQKLKTK